MLTRYHVEMKYSLMTLALLEGLVALDQTRTLGSLDAIVGDLFDRMSGLGFVGMFIVAVIGNSALLVHIPYTVPLLSLALGGASFHRMLLMAVASGLGAAVGEIVSYAVSLKLLGEKPSLERSSLLRWVKRLVNSHPRLIPPLLFVYAVSPLPDDTVIIPLAMVRYGFKQILPPLFTGKIIHNLVIATVFYRFTSWSAARVSATVQIDLALGLLVLFVMIIAYQVEKSRLAKREEEAHQALALNGIDPQVMVHERGSAIDAPTTRHGILSQTASRRALSAGRIRPTLARAVRLLKRGLMKRQTPGIILLVALLWTAFAAVTYAWLIPSQQKSDFLPRWFGAREVLCGTNPYTLRSTADLPEAKGLPRIGAFRYPATITYSLLPFWLLPFEVASSLWCGLQLVLFSLLPLLVYRNLAWTPSPRHYAFILLLSTVGFPYSLNVYTLGQFTGLCLASLVLAWWGIIKGKHLVTALSLVLATTRPDGAVIAAAILIILLTKRQFAALAIWGAVMVGVFLLSLLQIGWWVPDFLERAAVHRSPDLWPPQLLGATVLELVFVAGTILWGVGLFCRTWAWPDRDLQLLWGLAVIIVMALLLLPQTNDYTLVYLLLPIWVLLWQGRDSITTPVLFLWLPVMSYAAKYGYESSGRTADVFLWLNELATPLVIAALLTYEWSRFVKSAYLQPQSALGRRAECIP